jgi:hypothetical protein
LSLRKLYLSPFSSNIVSLLVSAMLVLFKTLL